jgi:hypothetical protein
MSHIRAEKLEERKKKKLNKKKKADVPAVSQADTPAPAPEIASSSPLNTEEKPKANHFNEIVEHFMEASKKKEKVTDEAMEKPKQDVSFDEIVKQTVGKTPSEWDGVGSQ